MTEKLPVLNSRLEPCAEFKFGRFISFYHPFKAQTVDETSAAIMHEIGHFELVMNTSFGMFQDLLGSLAIRDCIPEYLRELYQTASKLTLEHSLLFHEGYASTRELLYSRMNSPDSIREIEWTMTPFSRNAADPIILFLNQAEFYVALSEPLMGAIAEVILNTPILEDMHMHTKFLSMNWTKYFQSQDRNPNVRYEMFYSKAKQGNLPQEVSSAVLDNIRTTYQYSSIKEFLIEFQTKFSYRKRSQANALMKFVAKKALMKGLPFKVISKRKRLTSYKSLYESWSDILATQKISIGKGPVPSRKSRRNTTDLYLNNIQYIPRLDEESIRKLTIEYDQGRWDELYHTLVEVKTVIYVYLTQAPFSESLPQTRRRSSSKHHLTSLYIHESIMDDDKILFQCPLDKRVIIGARAKACVVHFEPKELEMALFDLSRIDSVITLSQRHHMRIKNLGIYNRITEMFENPLVIYPNDSTLNNWRRIIRNLLKEGETYIYHHQVARKPYRALDLCYATSANGKVAYVIPTLHPTFKRLLQLESQLKKLNKWHQFNHYFADAWVGRLRIAGMHYYIYGF